MQPKSEQVSEWFTIDPDSRLGSLTRFDDNDVPFVSCYLDMRAGRAACHAFLKRKVTTIRRALGGIERFEFDCAVEMIYSALQAQWSPQAQGMIVFARGLANDRHLDVLHSSVPLDNRLVRYSKPEILPLVALQQREPAFALLLAGRDQFRLFERKRGALTGPTLVQEAPRSAGLQRLLARGGGNGSPTDPQQQADWRFCRALTASSLPLIIAGDLDELSDAVDWLPQSVIDRLVGTLPYVAEMGLQAALHSAREQIRGIGAAESSQLARHLVDEASELGHAVTGYRPTLQAIRDGHAATLVIADWDQPGLGLPWEEEIGICHEALRSGVRIVLSDSVALRGTGGVGCLLKPEQIEMPVLQTAVEEPSRRAA